MTDIETLAPDEFMGPRRYKVTCRCLRCGREYAYVTKRASDERPCPRRACKAAELEAEIERRARNMAAIIESQRAPGVVGDKIIVKAIDSTAEQVMQDYGMTDLKDNIRQGEAMAPKLPPDKQKLADGYFGGEAVAERLGVSKRQMTSLGRRAIGGAFRNMAINPGMAVPGKQGEAPLTLVRTEKLK